MRELLAPWRDSRTWWALVDIVLTFVVGTIVFAVVVPLVAVSVGLLIVFVLAIPVIWVTWHVTHGIATAERSRIQALLGVTIDNPVPKPRGSWWRRFVSRLRSRERWRELAYCLFAFPVGAALAVAALVAWCGSLALIGLPAYAPTLPGGTAKFGLFEVGGGLGALLLAGAGLTAAVFVAPWVTIGAARLHLVFARRLLGPSRNLARQVDLLESRRVAAVDSAEAERRRIERDLHDGAQQRLVAVAMNLGEARERADEDPEAAKQLLVSAHEEAKEALAELRNLVRGVHPVILEDRGLDAALSAVVARAPVPVTLLVDLDERPSAAVEGAAYFLVAEALTNVAEHAEATHATVTISRDGEHLVVQVFDDGRGGADFAGGTGLRGLEDRANALGGELSIVSPPGGPTVLRAELPCES